MELFLQIIGGIVVFIVMAILAIYFYMRIKMGKYYNHDASAEQTPLFIHLNEDPMPEWTKKQDAIKTEQQLVDLGFTGSKAYTIYEMPGYQLKSYFNPPFIAVMYQHDIAGVWIDIVAETEKGFSYTTSNAPMGETINTRDNVEKHFDKTATPAQVFMKITRCIADQPCKEIQPSDFREYFETEYKKDMTWTNRNGGITLQEFTETAKATNKKYSDKDIKVAFIEAKTSEIEQWREAAIEEYRTKYKLSQDDFEDTRYELFIVPSQTNTEAFLDYLCGQYFISEENAEKYKKVHSNETNVPTLFKLINESMSPELRAKEKGVVDYPIEITIFRTTNRIDDY